MAPPGRPRERALRAALIALLAVASGVTDAVGYLALGGAFASVMTGNLVIVGLGLGRGHPALAARAALAVASFITGVAVGTRLTDAPPGGNPLWPSRITRALATETAVLTAGAVLWWVSGPQRHGGVVLALLATNAVALGIQSAAVTRFGEPGLSTTYLTGTLTTTVARLVTGGSRRAALPGLRVLLALVAGAAAGAVLTRAADWAPPALQLTALVVVLAASRPLARTPARQSATVDRALEAP